MIINIDAPPPSKTGQSKLSDPAASSPVAAQCIPPFTTQQTDNLREAVIELTHIKCYRDWEVDEWSADTLTHIHGYRSLEYEFISQTGVFGENPRSISAGGASA
jgi:hypothetical protein